MGRPSKIIIYVTFYIAALVSGIQADAVVPRLEPAPWAARIGGLAEPLPLSALIEAALMSSGAESSAVPGLTRRLHDLIDGLPGYLRDEGDELPRGEGVLHYLHDTVLRRYSEPQTRIDTLLTSGSYNCVSSAVLYAIMASSIGLPVEGILTSDHAFCRVVDETGPVDVETTNPYGYNPGQKREFTDAFGQTGFSYVPPGNYRLRTPIGTKELTGLILQNRISLLQRREAIEATVPLAVDRHALAGSEATGSAMRKEFVNYASVLNGRGRYLEALEFLDTLRKRWGDSADYLPIVDTLLYNAAVVASREGEGEAILPVLIRREERGDLSADAYRTYRELIGEGLIYRASRQQTAAEALAYLEELKTRNLLSDSTYTEYLVLLHGMRAQEISSTGADIAALRYLEGLDRVILADPRLKKALQVFSYNAAAQYHNRFVTLFREKEYERAENLLKEALAELPESPLLLKDHKTLQSIR